jgi:hypothetical protein
MNLYQIKGKKHARDQQTLEYALLAGRAYQDSREPENRIPEPDGWVRLEPKDTLGHTRNTKSGFAAVAFRKGNEIVISYAGTTFRKPRTFLRSASWAYSR